MTSNPTPPHVLLVTGEYPPAVGGVGDYTALLAAHLRGAGAHVSVLTGRVPGAADEPGVRRIVSRWGIGCWYAIESVVRAEYPHLIHIQYQAGAFDGRGAVPFFPRWYRGTVVTGWSGLMMRLRPPTVVTFHDLLAPYLFPKAGPLRPLALRSLARAGAAVIATNGEDYRQLQADSTVAAKLHLIPIGSNIPTFPHARDRAATRQRVRARLGVGDDQLLLAYFGLVSASKGLDTLLDALQNLEGRAPGRYRLLLIGGKASETDQLRLGGADDLEGELAARGLTSRVTATGTLPPDEVAAQLAAADLAVLPYRDGASWRRGSLLAALAQGTPVVTTRPHPDHDAAGQLPVLLDGENALLVPPDDAAALAAVIAQAGDDLALRERLAAGAWALGQHFGWETIAARHLAVYETVLAGRSARSGRVQRAPEAGTGSRVEGAR